LSLKLYILVLIIFRFVEVPQLKERLETFKYVLEFGPKFADMQPQVASLLRCSKYVVEEKKITKFLEVIIDIDR
jgi:hypothetical protein